MNPARSFLDCLEDIQTAAAKATTFLSGMSLAEFTTDEKTAFAVVRALGILGEGQKLVRVKHPREVLHDRAQASGRGPSGRRHGRPVRTVLNGLPSRCLARFEGRRGCPAINQQPGQPFRVVCRLHYASFGRILAQLRRIQLTREPAARPPSPAPPVRFPPPGRRGPPAHLRR